jgi:hypothetical protein
MIPMIFSSFCPRDCDRPSVKKTVSRGLGYSDTVIKDSVVMTLISFKDGGQPPDGWLYAGWMIISKSTGVRIPVDPVDKWLCREFLEKEAHRTPSWTRLLNGELECGGEVFPGYLKF